MLAILSTGTNKQSIETLYHISCLNNLMTGGCVDWVYILQYKLGLVAGVEPNRQNERGKGNHTLHTQALV